MTIKNEQINNRDLETVYALAMHDFDLYATRFAHVDKELSMTKHEIQVLTLANKPFLGMDKYVEDNLMRQLYSVKDLFFTAKRSINKKQNMLQEFFVIHPEKRALFNLKKDAVYVIMNEKEEMVDKELDKCLAYLKLYEATASV